MTLLVEWVMRRGILPWAFAGCKGIKDGHIDICEMCDQARVD